MSSLAKPIKGTAKKARRKNSREKLQMYREQRQLCFERDRGRCRACYTGGLTLEFTGSPFNTFQAHHVKYRSRGGSDLVGNLCGTCVSCHTLLHYKHLSVTGDPNGVLIFREYDRQTRELLRKWESPL